MQVQRNGLFAPARRGLTIGLVLTVTLVAFEALAVITILPVIKDDLGGLRLYGWVTSAFFLGTLVGIVVAGAEADRRGPGPPYLLGIVLFSIGLAIGGLAPTMLVLVLIGPGLSALVATHFGWRYVFLGLLPLVLLAAGLALPAVARIGPPPQPAARGARLLDAVRVSAGAGLLLSGLTSRSPVAAPPLAAAGLVVGVRPLLRLLPPGTLRARRGLPMAVLSRGMLTFAFFGSDTYVPLAITAVKGRSAAVAGIAVSATTLTWTLGAWVQERKATAWSSRRFVRSGLALLVAGIAGVGLSLLDAVPVPVAVACWAVSGLGIGLAYSPLSVTVLGLAPAGGQGGASAQLQLADTLGTALGAGLGGVLIAAGAAARWPQSVGIAGAWAVTGTVALAAVVLTRRLPDRKVPATGAGARWPGPGGHDAPARPGGPGSRPRRHDA